MRKYCGEHALVERTRSQLDCFVHYGRMAEGVRGDRGNSRDGSRRRINWCSQRGYSGEEHINRPPSVGGDSLDVRVGESCGEDVSLWRGDGRDSCVGCDVQDESEKRCLT